MSTQIRQLLSLRKQLSAVRSVRDWQTGHPDRPQLRVLFLLGHAALLVAHLLCPSIWTGLKSACAHGKKVSAFEIRCCCWPP